MLGERGDEAVRRIGIALCMAGLVLAALALSGGASASHLSRSDFKSASKYCKALRAELGGKAFKKKFHAKRLRGAQRRCVKRGGAARALAPVTTFPPPSDACPPPTEPAFPVHAFAGDPCAQPAPVACAEDDADEDAQGDDDDQGDDDHGDDDDHQVTAARNSDATCDETSGDDGNRAVDDEDEHHSDDSDDDDSDDD
jgi:hypothetical protein